MFKKKGVVATIWNIVVALIFMAFGIATIINFQNADFQKVIILIVGIFVVTDASLRLLTQVIHVFRVGNEVAVVRADLAAAAAASSELAIGVMLIMVSCQDANYLNTVFDYIAKFIAILFIVLGAIAILFASIYIARKLNSFLINLGVIFLGIVGVAAGILILAFASAQNVQNTVFLFVGILFMLVAVAMISINIILLIAAKRVKEMAEEEGEEVVVHEITEVQVVSDQDPDENE